MANNLVARAFELFEAQPGTATGRVNLLGATLRVPLWLEGWQHASDFLEADALRRTPRPCSGLATPGSFYDAGTLHVCRLADSMI